MINEIDLVEPFGHIRAVQVSAPQDLALSLTELPAVYLELIQQLWQAEAGPVTYISDLFIIAEFRKRGLAAEIMDNFLKAAEGLVFLIAGSLETPPNFEIVTFYENFGFEIISEDFDFPLMMKKST